MINEKLAPFIIKETKSFEKIVVDEVNEYIARIGYNIEFNKNKMVEMLELYMNNPYTGKHLKNGMWVWDERYKRYRKIKSIRYLASSHNLTLSMDISFLDGYANANFEENRFYPREVTNES